MTLAENKILAEFRVRKETIARIETSVLEKINELVKNCGIMVYAINHRIKEEGSLQKKLERKGDKYASLSDITDILGFRIVCFFADDVDKIAQQVVDTFNVDWSNSIDKRKILDSTSFGYLALHYICSIKDGEGIPADFKNFRFEVQMCSLLQHAWAVMEHDLGYKTKFGVPNAVLRDFSRLAGLLEIADEHFSRIRDTVASYTEQVHQKIVEDNAGDVRIDSVSLNEYMRYNKSMRAFLQSIADYGNLDFFDASADVFLEQLSWLKKKTIGDLQQMLSDNIDLARRMAQKELSESGFDIFASTISLRYLCQAELLRQDYSEKQAAEFFYLSSKNKEKAARYAQALFEKWGK